VLQGKNETVSSTTEPRASSFFADEVCARLLSDEKLLAAMARFEGALARASAPAAASPHASHQRGLRDARVRRRRAGARRPRRHARDPVRQSS
jgi:hypothetical protein